MAKAVTVRLSDKEISLFEALIPLTQSKASVLKRLIHGYIQNADPPTAISTATSPATSPQAPIQSGTHISLASPSLTETTIASLVSIEAQKELTKVGGNIMAEEPKAAADIEGRVKTIFLDLEKAKRAEEERAKLLADLAEAQRQREALAKESIHNMTFTDIIGHCATCSTHKEDMRAWLEGVKADVLAESRQGIIDGLSPEQVKKLAHKRGLWPPDFHIEVPLMGSHRERK